MAKNCTFHINEFTWWYQFSLDGFTFFCSYFTLFYITKTYLYNFDALRPHFYIVKQGFTGVYIFLISAQKHRLWVLVRTASPRRGGSNEYPQSMFWAEIWKISDFLSENFQFLMVKFSIYLNRRIFKMILKMVVTGVEWVCECVSVSAEPAISPGTERYGHVWCIAVRIKNWDKVWLFGNVHKCGNRKHAFVVHLADMALFILVLLICTSMTIV